MACRFDSLVSTQKRLAGRPGLIEPFKDVRLVAESDMSPVLVTCQQWRGLV
jgi:hypothetical protein